MNELELMVQRMIDAGESEENIAAVIKEYNSTQVGKTTPTSPGADVEETAAPKIQPTVTESPSVDTSLDLPGVKTGTVDSTLITKEELDKQKAEEEQQRLLVENLSIGESLNNAFSQAYKEGKKVGEFWSGDSPTLNIATSAIAQGVFGKENIDKISNLYGGVSVSAAPGVNIEIIKGIGSKTLLDNISKLEKEKAEAKPTLPIIQSFKQGKILKGIAGLLGSVVNVGGSVAYGLGTAATGYFMDFTANNYVSFNEGLAKRKNKTLEQLILDDEANISAPVALAGLQTAAEALAFGKITGKLSKVTKKASEKAMFNNKSLDIISTGRDEAITEIAQFGLEEYNKVLGESGDNIKAAGAFFSAIGSQEGLESGIQGFAGGAGIKGSRYMLNAANKLRASVDKEGIENDISELSKLNKKLSEAKDEVVKEGIQKSIDEVNQKLSNRIIKGNSILPNFSNKDINEISNMDDLATAQVKRAQELKAKLDANTITTEEYNVALEGFKKSYLEAKNRIQGVKENANDRSNKEAQKVNKLYEEKGKEGIAEILELYKPMAKRIASKYRNVPGFEMDLMVDEILTGERGILDLINSYKPETNVPLSAYVNKFAATRGIEAAQRNLKQEFELDVTEAKGVTDTTTIETQIEVKEQAKTEIKTELAKDLNLAEETQNEVVTAVEKTLGTKLPAVTDKNFKAALTKGLRTELTNTFKKVFGRTAAYEQFLRDNFEKIYPAIPQETINKKFKEFNEPVLDKDGKQVRERTAEGKKVFKKKDISKAEFIKYFLNAPGNVKGARKTSLAEVMADEIGLDNVLTSLSKPEVVEKFKAIQELQGQEVPSNFIEIISEKIDRAINYIEEWQKSNILRTDPGFAIAAEFVKKVLQSIKLSIKAGVAITEAIKKAVDEASKIFKTQPTAQEKTEYVKEISLDIKKYEDIDKLNIDDLMDRLSRIYYKNKGIQEEQNVILSLLDASKKSKLIKVISKKPAGSNSKGFDVEFEAGNQKINVEIKAANAQYSSITANFDLDSQEFSFSQDTLFNDLIKNELESVKKNISEYAKEAGSKTWPAKISKEKYKELGSSGKNIQKNITKTFEISPELIIDLYNKKNINYINIEGKGLYYLKQDIYNLGVPKFNPKATATIRIVPPGTSKKGIKTTTTRIFPKIDYKSLKKSSFDLSDSNSVVKLFKNISPAKNKGTLNRQFNEEILQKSKGVEWTKKFSPVEAQIAGKGKGKFKFFIPYSADDFVGLIYATLGKGKIGDQQMEWYKENLLRPFSRGIQQYEAAKQSALREWTAIKKEAKKSVPGGLNKKNDTGLTNQDAVRIYIWKKQNMEIPGTKESPGLIQENLKIVNANKELKSFADRLIALNPEGYPEPSKNWNSGDITTDLVSYIDGVKRSEFLTEFKDNAAEIFSDANKEKLRALYGDNYIEALDDMLHRMKTGTNRRFGASRIEKQFMDWTNNSVGAIMFFNARSAVLQTLSAVNFVNFTDNNPINAGIAFANQPQYWKDFSTLFNSNFLKQRRTGLQTDVNADEIARAAKGSKNTARAALSAILKFGFTPTQIADSFAIASGGATFYRNRINKYKKEGLSQQEAEKKAFTDFQEIAEETQQSARPDRISLQQASSLGRLILAFGNTPMQYARLTKKASLDLINGRGDWKTNVSKIMYYSVIQNIIFSALQQGLFALLFDDEDDDKEKSRLFRIGNSSLDTFLRGSGVYGAAAATVKNMILKIIEESEKSRPDYTKVAIESTALSPPINSKLRKLVSAGKTFTYKQSKEKVFTEGFSLENPAFLAGGQVVSALTNLPADRVVLKADHLKTAIEPETELWQSLALSLGWSEWDLNMIQNQTKKSKDPLKAIERIERKLKKY